MDKLNGKFTAEIREPEETGIFQLCFLSSADITLTIHTDCAPYLHLRAPACSRAVRRKRDGGLISAHLFQVDRQQKSRRQKLFLFVHHFGLT